MSEEAAKTNSSRGMMGLINPQPKESEEIIVAQAILSVTRAIESVPESQIPNVFMAVRAIYDTAHGKPAEISKQKEIDVSADMREIREVKEHLDAIVREQARQDQARKQRRGWFGRG